MNRIIIGCLIVGLVLIITTFLKFKDNQILFKYTKPKLNRLFAKLRNTKIISIFSSDSIKSNVKLLDKLKIISQCKRSEKLYKYDIGSKSRINELKQVKPKELLKNINLIRVLVVLCALTLSISIKLGFNAMVVKQSLDESTIYKQTNYKITKPELSSILHFIGNDYKVYFKANDVEGLENKIKVYKTDAILSIDNTSITSLCQIYRQAYEDGRLSIKDYIIIGIIALISNFLVIMYINVLYRMYKIKLLKEFSQVELISILHMNREGLNVFEILSEVNKYTVYLKPYITVCLNKYNSGPIGALDQLIKDVDDDGFSSFVAILKSCLDKPKDINTEVLKLQRKLRFLSKKIDSDKSLEFKELCLTIAQFPLIAMFICDLILPFIAKMNISNIFTF